MKKAIILISVVLLCIAIAACQTGNGPVSAAPPSGAASASAVVSATLFTDAAGTAKPSPSASASAPASTASATPSAEGFKFTAQNMPRIDGSTATIPLISAVRSVLLGIPREDKTTVSGTDNAYSQLIEGNADVLLVYAPAQKTLDYAKEKNIKLEMAPIGKDALVFLVNVKNPIKSLTPAQLVSIYAGSVTDWKDVGGKDAGILAYQRQLMSGSQTMMDKLVMKGTPMAKAPAEYIIGEMGQLVDAVAVYDGAENAIGYNVYYYVSRMKLDENIRLLEVGGVMPSTESIASGKYPFVNDFYAVIRGDAPKDSPQRVLFDWMLTENGQKLVAHEGYAPAGK
jgi:phosphate transport system substrate-binding protein